MVVFVFARKGVGKGNDVFAAVAETGMPICSKGTEYPSPAEMELLGSSSRTAKRFLSLMKLLTGNDEKKAGLTAALDWNPFF